MVLNDSASIFCISFSWATCKGLQYSRNILTCLHVKSLWTSLPVSA